MKKPINITVQASSNFAIELYKRLANQDPDANLFFSPFSIFSAMAMVGEGARGETAIEIGQTLQYQVAASQIASDDAQRIPWDTAKFHAHMAELHCLFNGDKDELEIPTTRKRITELQKDLAEIEDTAWGKRQKIVEELNSLLPPCGSV